MKNLEAKLNARLEALMAAPKPWVVVIAYTSGASREIPCLSEAAANNCADRERRKLGRDLIDRISGEIVRVASVKIELRI